MSVVLAEIRTSIGADNLSSCCNRDECEVSLEGIPSDRVIIDVDLTFKVRGIRGERCDFIVCVCNEEGHVVVIPVELKSGGFLVAKAARQIGRGAKFANESIVADPLAICRPILIHGRPLSDSQRKRLNRIKVKFGNRKLTIKTSRCDRRRNLAVALDDQ